MAQAVSCAMSSVWPAFVGGCFWEVVGVGDLGHGGGGRVVGGSGMVVPRSPLLSTPLPALAVVSHSINPRPRLTIERPGLTI